MSYCGPPNPDGVLTLATIQFDGPAIHALDPGQLWQRGQKRGTDRLVPFTPTGTGAVSYPRRYKPTQRTIHFGLHGNVSLETGDPRWDYIAGAYANLAYLNAQVCDPSVAGDDGTIDAQLVVVGGVTLAGKVTVENEIVVSDMLDAPDELGAYDYLMTCAITLTVAQGALTPV